MAKTGLASRHMLQLLVCRMLVLSIRSIWTLGLVVVDLLRVGSIGRGTGGKLFLDGFNGETVVPAVTEGCDVG